MSVMKLGNSENRVPVPPIREIICYCADNGQGLPRSYASSEGLGLIEELQVFHVEHDIRAVIAVIRVIVANKVAPVRIEANRVIVLATGEE
jgi:hypothetical protein